jgi:hypothetical protein
LSFWENESHKRSKPETTANSSQQQPAASSKQQAASSKQQHADDDDDDDSDTARHRAVVSVFFCFFPGHAAALWCREKSMHSIPLTRCFLAERQQEQRGREYV